MEKYVEYIGYLATAFVLLSFLMKNIITLRIINIIGCAIFILYGILISSWPVLITNSTIILINVFYLKKHYSNNSVKTRKSK